MKLQEMLRLLGEKKWIAFQIPVMTCLWIRIWSSWENKVVYECEINYLLLFLHTWKCLSTPHIFSFFTLSLWKEIARDLLAGCFVADPRVLLHFWRAFCPLCNILGFLGGHRTWRGSRSPPLCTLCGRVLLLERLILYFVVNPWNGQKHFCTPE